MCRSKHLKTFKQANPNLTREKAQKRVKEYYDTIKNKPDVENLAWEKITEWKRRYTETSEKHYFLSGKNQNLRYQHQVLTHGAKRSQM